MTLLSSRVTPFHGRNAGRRTVVEPGEWRTFGADGQLDDARRADTGDDIAGQRDRGAARRVQRFASALAHEMCAADAVLIEAVRTAALLHDIGKLAIPDRLLHKPGPLTREEYEQVKLHAAIGADMLEGIDFPGPLR